MFYWSILIGAFMVVFTIAFHAFGVALWTKIMLRWEIRYLRKASPWVLFHALVRTADVLLFLHFIEVVLWAVLYVALPGKAGLANFPEAVYFSLITYTTLGYGDITLAQEWNLLGGMEAMVGITLFGLTTAFLFAVIQRGWKLPHDSP
jgi:voltage-gated potassium channel Kch